jgi:lipoate-protein ligase B
VLLRTLRDFSINATRDESHAGIWVDQDEVAAIGLSMRNWVTMHGCALNISTKLEHFSFINPCGFTNRRATSMCKILGCEVLMEEVIERLVGHFSVVFDMQMNSNTGENLWGWQ